MTIRVKTFQEHQRYRVARVADGPPEFVPLDSASSGLDQQIADWQATSGAQVHSASPVGYHTSWSGDRDDPYRFRHITLTVSVLYVDADQSAVAGVNQSGGGRYARPVTDDGPAANAVGGVRDEGNDTAG